MWPKVATNSDSKKLVTLKDASRALFNAKVTREVNAQLPAEDIGPGEKDMVGKTNLCLYGIWNAAMNWQECIAEHLAKIGFRRGRAYPSLYVHQVKRIHTVFRADEYVSVGTKEGAKWLKGELGSAFEIKTDTIGYHDAELKSEGNILKATDQCRSVRLEVSGQRKTWGSADGRARSQG